MKIIKDVIYKYIRINENEQKLIDSPELQRLRRIRQLPFSYLVYPGANHTRFEHSLGVMHVAGKIAEKLNLDVQKFRIAGLLHDIGHGPFSHLSEMFLSSIGEEGKHEKIVWKVLKGELGKILNSIGYSKKEIYNLIIGKGKFSEIISGGIDADRIDYLQRDAYYTGSASGRINAEYIINLMEKFRGKIVIPEKGLLTAEEILLARYMMRNNVYLHHTTLITSSMLLHSLYKEYENGNLKIDEFVRMDDYSAFNFLRNNEIFKRIIERRLFKRAFLVRYDEINKSKIKELYNYKKLREVEKEIAEKANVNKEEIIIDIRQLPEKSKINVLVKWRGKVRNIEEISKFMKVLNEAEKDRWYLGIYTPKEKVKMVSKVAKKILGRWCSW